MFETLQVSRNRTCDTIRDLNIPLKCVALTTTCHRKNVDDL